MNNKGASLVELIAVIVIIGVIAGITTVSVVSVINRQKKNSTILSLNNIYESTKELLIAVETGIYDENITLLDDDFAYISLTTLIDSGNVDGKDYKPINNEVFFCYNMESYWVLIDSTISKTKPSSTNVAMVYNVNVTFDYNADKFISA